MRLTTAIKDKIVNKLLSERQEKLKKDKIKISLEFKEEYSKTLPVEIQNILNNKELEKYLVSTTYFYINCPNTSKTHSNLPFNPDYSVRVPLGKPGVITVSNELYDKITTHLKEEKLVSTLRDKVRSRLSNIQTDSNLHDTFPEAYQAYKSIAKSLPVEEVKKLNKVITIESLMQDL